MSLFAIADTHLSLTANKPMDCFEGWENYVSRLEKGWNSVVQSSDTVVVAGDISWAVHLNELYADFDFLNKLNGRKIIIKGNHDYWWSTLASMNRFVKENGFDSITFINNNSFDCGGVSVCGSRGWLLEANEPFDEKMLKREIGRIAASIDSADKDEKIVFLHYPPVTTNNLESDIFNLLQEKGIKKCYYGHLHGKAANYAYQGALGGIIFKLISADTLNFTPYLIKKY
ncbi:MAG: metallophosphoesterase [Clostridiales bacterium]|nr:metallophosphoesterase [Clostridiales bacterium]